MRITMRRTMPLLLLIIGSGASVAQTQSSGDIRGIVSDASEAVIPDATVTVLNVDTGVSKDYTTNQSGLYDTSSILAGNYTITFSKQGFEGLVRGPVTLNVGYITVNAVLKVGSTTEQITVSTDVPLLHTESGDQTVTLESKEMAQLPQVTQSWENFVGLLPGTSGQSGAASISGQAPASNGNLPYHNILSDGASVSFEHTDNAFTQGGFESLGELQVSLSSFSAQYGVGGMVINQITKSGTNQFHGSAYDYLQNDAFESHPHFYGIGTSPAIPILRYNDFGGSIGGPILKKRMFFYFNYDQIVDHTGASNSVQTIPTTAVMGGDFTSDTRTIYDPTTQTIALDSAGNPYPVRKSFLQEYGSNKIPSTMIDPVAQASEALFFPTPSSHTPNGKFLPGTTNTLGMLTDNWYSSIPSSAPWKRYFGRLDYDITPNNRLTASDSDLDNPGINPSSIAVSPIDWQGEDQEINIANISDVWNISPTMINEARMGFTYGGSFYTDLALGKDYPAKIGWQFAKANTFPTLLFSSNNPQVPSTYPAITAESNSVYKQQVFDPSDVVTMIRGKHILHFGGEFLFYRDDSTQWGNSNPGTMAFSGAYTQQWSLNASGVAQPNNSQSGIDYADFLLGMSGSWNAAVTPEFGARMKSPQVFIQDDYKLSPTLTINAGLRYDINHGWNEVHGNEISFDPTVTNLSTNTLGASWYGVTHANGRKSLFANNLDTFLPRLGFSWLVRQNTTVRAGFGLYDDPRTLDRYGSGLGIAFADTGSDADQTNGITPIVKLNGTGTVYGTSTPLPFTSASTSSAAYNGQSVSYTQFHTPVMKIWEWTASVQRELRTNLVAEVTYVGSHGINGPGVNDFNAIPIGKLSSNDSQYRPYPQYQSITGQLLDGVSNYDSLQAQITKRFSSGLSFNFNYVWSHFLTDWDSQSGGSGNSGGAYQIANDSKANYSNSSFDVRQAFKGYAVYRLPFGRGMRFVNNNSLLDAVIGGWQLSGSTIVVSGSPYTVYADGNTYQLAAGSSQFPNWNPGVSPKPAHRSTNEWFNPQAFTKPANGTFGDVRRNSLYGPASHNVNLSGSKTFTLPWESVKLQIRADLSNAFNSTSWGVPSAVYLASPDSNGVYTGPVTDQIMGSSVSGRNMQLGAHLSF
jgi:hypothetical protein